MWEFEEELQRPHDPQANDIDRIGRLRLLYQGHFLQHETEKPWVLRRARSCVIDCCAPSAMRRMSANSRAVGGCCEPVSIRIELDSLNEGLYRGLMLCHQELGDHSDALQAYSAAASC